ncbi:MAG TPA: LysR substrate-binding domain-containing protein [Luteibacter sp.]|jgi:LysR family glycine cleavage system transcriptional activator|nr:LysR substrate-binding domain-containing protein [Luteibacter sp.]
MRSLPPLNPLLAFEAASRHLNFTKAARELNVTQGAISHQIAVLEEYFGARLFERKSNQLELTPGAALYAEALHAAFEDMRRATTNFYATASLRTTLTIKGYPLLLSRWLTPRLPAFSRQFPNIDVRLVSISGASLVDFENQDIDVGIRYGSGRWKGLTSHLLFADELVPVCTKAFAEKLGLHTPQDLAGKVLLQTHARASDWPDWFRCAGVSDTSALRELMSFEDLGVVLRFAIEGSGIAILQRAYVEDDIREGRLVVPCEPVLRRDLGYHLVTPVNNGKDAKVREFSDWLLGSINPDGEPAAA